VKSKANVTTLDDDRILIPVTGAEDEAPPVEEEETPAVDGVSKEETPEPSEEDERLVQLQSDYETIKKDLDRQKGAFQRRENEIQKDYKAREDKLKKQLDELRRSTMNTDDADKYEKEVALERIEELQRELENERAGRMADKQFDYWKNQFTDVYGIPHNKLVEDQGIEELVTSGMEAIKELISKAKQEVEKPVKKAQSKNEPPETPKPAKGGAAAKMTLQEVAAKYTGGDLDAVYRQFETGQLPRTLFDELAEGQEQKV